MSEEIDRLCRRLKNCQDSKEQVIGVLEYIIPDLNCPWDPEDVATMYASVQERLRKDGAH
jgi:hypothetical protein